MDSKDLLRWQMALLYSKARKYPQAVRLLEAIDMERMEEKRRFEGKVELAKGWMHMGRLEEAREMMEGEVRDMTGEKAGRDGLEVTYYEACVSVCALLLLRQDTAAMGYYQKAVEAQRNSQVKLVNLGRIASKYFDRSTVRSLLLSALNLPLPPISPVSSPAPSPESLCILCVKVGDKYGSEYVNKLYNGILRHFPSPIPFTFTCLTDQPHGLNPNIEVEIIDGNLPIWWSKVLLFTRNRADLMVYFDLDIVLTGDISALAHYPGSFLLLSSQEIACEDSADGYNSSVMVWRSDQYRRIYSDFMENKERVLEVMDRFDHWLEVMLPEVETMQGRYPGMCRDFTQACSETLPPDCQIVIFPQSPKPSDYPSPWVRLHWL